MNYTFHPLAEEFPLLADHELARLERGMEEHGFDPRFPIVLYGGKVLDGRNRYLAACRAGVKPAYVEFQGTEAEAAAFVQLANEDRRHLAVEWLRKRREERIARVAEARAEGKSTRLIAEEEGVSESQVRQDLAKATAQGCAVEPEDGKVKGKDGKKRAATRKKAKPTAQGCAVEKAEDESTGQGCPVEDPPPPPKPAAPVEVDEWGIPIQPHARAAFDAVPQFKAMLDHLQAARKIYDDLAGMPAGRFLHFYSRVIRGPKGKDKVRHKGLEEAISQIKLCVPAHTVCPYEFADHGHPDECSCCHGMKWTATLAESAESLRGRARKAFGLEG